MKKLDVLGILGIFFITILVTTLPSVNGRWLTALISGTGDTVVARANIVSAPTSVRGDGKTPAIIDVLISNNKNSKLSPLSNYCVQAKHAEDGVGTNVTCTPSGADGISKCSYTLATSTNSKFKVCEAVPCGQKPIYTNTSCNKPLAKTFINFYGEPSRYRSTLETIKNGSIPGDPTAIVRVTMRDSAGNPVAGYPVNSIYAQLTSGDEDNVKQNIPCGTTDVQGVTTCQMTSSTASTWVVYDWNKFNFSEQLSFSSPVNSLPRHIVWTVQGSDVFEQLKQTADSSSIGDLKAIALSEIDVVGAVSGCEENEANLPGDYEVCFRWRPHHFKNNLGLKQLVIIDEPFGFPCDEDNPATLSDERNGYRCRNTEATLKYIKEIAKKQSYTGQFLYDGIILDEPAYRSHQPGGDGDSIYTMDHPSRLIHKIFEETKKLHPGFKIILAENSSAFIQETLKPGPDGVVQKYDLISGYWFFSPNPDYIKSLVPKYANGSGMWVNAATWNPRASETLKKYNMNTTLFLFGTGSGLQIPFATLRDQILPSLR